jgi:hypothetical protein
MYIAISMAYNSSAFVRNDNGEFFDEGSVVPFSRGTVLNVRRLVPAKPFSKRPMRLPLVRATFFALLCGLYSSGKSLSCLKTREAAKCS